LSKNFQNDTKKDKILKMLLDKKKHSAKVIARTVGTTEGNVFKEKSRLKAQGVLTDQSFSVFSHSVGDETSL
jgi:biotin operon repressor